MNYADTADAGNGNQQLYLTEEERLRQEKMMLKYKMMLQKPYLSDNIFMELNITNLSKFYQRAISELQDARDLFNIKGIQDEELAVRPPLNSRIKPPDIRILFEEICYLSRVTNL